MIPVLFSQTGISLVQLKVIKVLVLLVSASTSSFIKI